MDFISALEKVLRDQPIWKSRVHATAHLAHHRTSRYISMLSEKSVRFIQWLRGEMCDSILKFQFQRLRGFVKTSNSLMVVAVMVKIISKIQDIATWSIEDMQTRMKRARLWQVLLVDACGKILVFTSTKLEICALI
jgi:hypothetical protein